MDMNNPVPRVSVIIPTYNQAVLLEKALRSVAAQTFPDWEAIVIDNFSLDGTRDVVESMQDPRIRYVAFANQGVIAASRNLGIRLAQGSVIAFLDSDDLWYPSKLSACLGCMDRGADAVCHALRIRRGGVLEGTLGPKQGKGDFFTTLLYRGNSTIATSAVMVKMECFERFGVFSEDPSLVTAEDYELWLRLSNHQVAWGFLPEALGEYTIHGKNASSNVNRQMLAEETVVLWYFKKHNSPHIGERFLCRKRRIMLVFRAGIRIWQSGHRYDSLPYFLKGLSRIFI